MKLPLAAIGQLPEKTFILITNFVVPTGWDKKAPAALYLPIGIAGDFSHPEALVYLDGKQYRLL